MATLSFTAESIQIEDFDGNEETICRVTAYIDGQELPEQLTANSDVTVLECKTNLKNKLTELGYTWDSEE